jgi:hypothetical protein
MNLPKDKFLTWCEDENGAFVNIKEIDDFDKMMIDAKVKESMPDRLSTEEREIVNRMAGEILRRRSKFDFKPQFSSYDELP